MRHNRTDRNFKKNKFKLYSNDRLVEIFQTSKSNLNQRSIGIPIIVRKSVNDDKDETG